MDGTKGAVLGLADAVLEAQDQGRHEDQHRCQAAHNALGEHKAQVPTDGKAHQSQRHKPTMVVTPLDTMESTA